MAENLPEHVTLTDGVSQPDRWHAPTLWVSSGARPDLRDQAAPRPRPLRETSTLSDPTFLYGTLDALILKTLSGGSRHGYGIARWLEQATGERIRVEESSLYPALYRMEKKGLLRSEWGRTELERRAKFYSLTDKGRHALEHEASRWADFADAVSSVLLAPEGDSR